jgi:Cache 3/Cache 2 fusion domain
MSLGSPSCVALAHLDRVDIRRIVKPGRQQHTLSLTERRRLTEEVTHMNRRRFLVGIVVADLFIASSLLMPNTSSAQADPKVAKAMALLKAETAKLGAPKVEGTDKTSDKTTPGLYFGTTKVNNNFAVVDKVKAEAGGTATLFVKAGDEYVRVSTNVPGKVDGRALGTILDPKGKAIVEINQGKAFYGEVDILGTMYVTGYEPIKDAAGKVIGIWYVGYPK